MRVVFRKQAAEEISKILDTGRRFLYYQRTSLPSDFFIEYNKYYDEIANAITVIRENDNRIIGDFSLWIHNRDKSAPVPVQRILHLSSYLESGQTVDASPKLRHEYAHLYPDQPIQILFKDALKEIGDKIYEQLIF